MKWLLAIATFAVATIANAAAEPPSNVADYATLPAHKALATAANDTAGRGIASSESSDVLASANALARCNAAVGSSSPCEISRLDDLHVTTANEMRAQVPRTPHPLFLWKFESKSAATYLAGSIHVMKPTLYPLPAQFDGAYAQSDRLAIEVDTDAVAPDVLREKLQTYALLPTGQTLETVLAPDAYKSVDAYLQTQGGSLAPFDTLKPAMVATQPEKVKPASSQSRGLGASFFL